MRIDAHQHFWRYNPQRDTWIGEHMIVLKRDFMPEQLALELTSAAIDASIAVQADQSEAETLFLLRLCETNASIAGVVGWVDLRSPAIEDRLQYFSQFGKLCGFRHIVQAEPDDEFMLQPDFVRGVRALEHFGYSYDLLVYPRQLPAAIRLAEKLPDQRFVLDHIAKPEIARASISPWREDIRELARNPNVYCKLSGLVTEARWQSWKGQDFRPYLEVVLEAFGPGRLMFGSDWPVCLLAASYTRVKTVIADYVRQAAYDHEEAIFGGNAMRFYRLKSTGSPSGSGGVGVEWTCN